MRNAIETINNIINTNLYLYPLKYCLVDSTKHPYKIDNTLAKPNNENDFVELEELLQNDKLETYAGVGISVQASKICAIDVDHCFSIPFDTNSEDERAKDIINRFKDIAYIEFSFSGTGLRVLFKEDLVDDYSIKFYIKNESKGIEYYQPAKSYRYVTITGRSIYNNELKFYNGSREILFKFLQDYMLKPKKENKEIKTTSTETRTLEQLMEVVKYYYFKDMIFQKNWFDKAPGSGKNESERDFALICFIFSNITQDKCLIKEIFEKSPFYNSKDYKHKNKWKYGEFRYYNYLYDKIKGI